MRLRFFMDLLIKKRVPIMLVGGAGSGKSVIMADKLASLSDNYNIANVPFNFYTTSGTFEVNFKRINIFFYWKYSIL